MSPYCLKCKKNKESINPRVSKSNNGKTMTSKCAMCGRKKSRFIKKQDVRGILSNLGLKTPLNKIPLWVIYCFRIVKMNKTVKNFY